MKPSFRLFLAPLVLGAALPAAETVPVPETLDLPTAIRFAVENNFAVRQARERIRQQDGVVLEVSAREIPRVGASAVYQRNDRDIAFRNAATATL